MSTKSKKSKSEGVDFPDLSEISAKEVKTRVTTFIDTDVLRALKKEAKAKKSGYQTLLNEYLRAAVLGSREGLTLLDRIEGLENQIKSIKKSS